MKKPGGTVKYPRINHSLKIQMSNSSFSKDFWTRVLAEHNLESPGYHEAVRQTNEYTAQKKQMMTEPVDKKTKTKKKKK